jgi:hypothetical protein
VLTIARLSKRGFPSNGSFAAVQHMPDVRCACYVGLTANRCCCCCCLLRAVLPGE